MLAKGGIWVPMTDLFGVEGNLLLDNVRMARTVPGADRVAAPVHRSVRRRNRPVHRSGPRRLARDPDYTAIQQIPGIGPVLGAVFVAEIGDVHRFPGPEQLTS